MKKIILLTYILLALAACKKQDEWLDVKSNKSDVIPNTLKDFQALLDNTNVMNNLPSMGQIGSDNTSPTDAMLQAAGITSERNAILWAPDIYEDEILPLEDWATAYRMVEYSNIVLEGLKKITPTGQNEAEYNNVYGSALFYRGLAFYSIAQLYAKPYVKSTASTDLGIVIRLAADVNEKSVRSTLQQSYDQIISDFTNAAAKLPLTSIYSTRPNRSTTFAYLSKVYLAMEEYPLALINAEESLKINNTLLNYNTITSTATFPFPTYQSGNPEVKFFAYSISYSVQSLSNMVVEPTLYNSYSNNDLRKTLFYRINADGTKNFKGRYTGNAPLFGGLGNNEVYLIKAECQARAGAYGDSMATLNSLLITRWVTGTYVPYSASNENDALNIILNERRKDLPFTGSLRWEDLRRLNRDPRFAKTLTRTIAGKTYSLPPNDPRYTFPIIPIEIAAYGLQQNPR
jgi:tetratricopeptide (TPR) repeat protein